MNQFRQNADTTYINRRRERWANIATAVAVGILLAAALVSGWSA